MTMLKGRPVSQNAGNPDSQKPSKPEQADDTITKVTIRLGLADHRRMKMHAVANGISTEDAYQAAVSAYLKTV